MADGLRIITDPLDIPDVDESHPFDHSRDSIVEFPKPQIVEPATKDPEPAEPKDIEPAVSPDVPAVATPAKPKAPRKREAPIETANNDEEFVTLSVRLPTLFYREVNIHLVRRREQAQDFVPRAVKGLLDREKDREVVLDAPKTKLAGPVTMLSARIEASIYFAMKEHVIKHGEKMQGWSIRAFTEQMEIDNR